MTNRHLIKTALCIHSLLSSKQVHADRVYSSVDVTGDLEVNGFDALITCQRGIGLMIQQADCQAVLMHDPDNQVIAAVHCGWRGSVLNIIGKTIATMRQAYRADPAALFVAVSPSLGPCCAEFVNYRQELPEELHRFRVSPDHFNFWEITSHQLIRAGVPEKNIDIARICSSCSRDYFSYRRTKREGGVTTGRNGSVICLPPT